MQHGNLIIISKLGEVESLFHSECIRQDVRLIIVSLSRYERFTCTYIAPCCVQTSLIVKANRCVFSALLIGNLNCGSYSCYLASSGENLLYSILRVGTSPTLFVSSLQGLGSLILDSIYSYDSDWEGIA